jgi:transcriptional regulator with XRE-family HTH domain
MTPRDLRISLGLTQKEFADKLGVSFRTVGQWEAKKNPSEPSALARYVLERLAKIVEKSPSKYQASTYRNKNKPTKKRKT